MKRILAILGLAVALAAPAAAADYYVSGSGSDRNPGTLAKPWRTADRVNKAQLLPGDTVRFAGGQVFGFVYLDHEGGLDGAPITITSDGNAATLRGLMVYNGTGHVRVHNLAVVSGPGSGGAGVQFYGDQPHVRYPGLVFAGLDVSGFRDGILVGTWGCGTCGTDDLVVADSVSHHNVQAGVNVYAEAKGNHRGLLIQAVVAHNNSGDPAKVTNSGSGIVIGQVDGGVIEHSEAYENGALCTAGECGAGIWAYDSNAVTIRDSYSHHNRTGSHVDGDGFDLDGGVTNSLVERNIAHDNDGAGFLLAQYAGASFHGGNVIRNNVSRNDGVRTGFGAFHMFGDLGPQTVTGNTFGGPRQLYGYGNPPNPLVDGNTYEGPFSVIWNGVPYTDLAAFQAATGQEPGTPSPEPSRTPSPHLDLQ